MGKRPPDGLIHKRRMLVGQLWLRGNSERAIAEMIQNEAHKSGSQLKGCELTTHVTVHKDVVACRAEWLKRDGDKLDDKRAEQVARILDTIRQAFTDLVNLSTSMRPQCLRLALDGQLLLAKITGTLAPTRFTDGDGKPLMPPIINLKFADGTVLKPPSNNVNEPVELLSDGNGHGKPA